MARYIHMHQAPKSFVELLYNSIVIDRDAQTHAQRQTRRLADSYILVAFSFHALYKSGLKI